MVRIIEDDESTELLKDQLEKKKTDTISIRLPSDLMERFKDYCYNEDIKPNTLLKEMVSNKVNDIFIYRGNYKPFQPITIYLPDEYSDFDMVMNGFDLTETPQPYIENLMINDIPVGAYELLDIITLGATNNKLDVWTTEGYKSNSSSYEHEGLIIYEYEGKEKNFIYLIKILRPKNHGYFCQLITLEQALGLSIYVENHELEVELCDLKSDKNKLNKLIENNLTK